MPISQPPDNAAPYTWTQPIRDSIGRASDLTDDADSATPKRIPVAVLGTGTPTGSKYLRDDRTWNVPPGGSVATTVNIQTGTTYTFVLGDADTVIVRAGNAGSQTYTIPPNASVNFPVGTTLTVVAYGAGALSLVQGAGVTLRPSSPQVARARYSTITAVQIAANEWIVGGDVQ